MRRSRVAAVAIVACGGLASCAISLDHEFDGAPGTDDDAGDASPPQATGCPVLAGVTDVPGAAGVAGVASLSGDARSLPLPDGGALWVVDQATLSDGGVALAATFSVGAGATTNCAAWSTRFEGAGFAPSPLAPGGLLGAEDLVWTSNAPALYYQLFVSDPTMPLDLRSLGFGIAPRDPASGLFVPTAELLWSADRPAYGGSALRMGNTVYVYGCASGGYLTSSCFVARADADGLTSTAAYTYWAGDHWSASADDAKAVVDPGGGAVSVRPDPRSASTPASLSADAAATPLIMTYVPTLGSTIVARTSLAPEGPWSAPTTLARCALDGAGPGAFCGGAQQHPELTTPPTAPLALTIDARTFATDAGAGPAFAPRLVTLAVP